MIYTAYYRRQSDGKPCVRIISRGFACTPAELPREIQTRCGARDVPEWNLHDTTSAAEVFRDDAVSRGLLDETHLERRA